MLYFRMGPISKGAVAGSIAQGECIVDRQIMNRLMLMNVIVVSHAFERLDVLITTTGISCGLTFWLIGIPSFAQMSGDSKCSFATSSE